MPGIAGRMVRFRPLNLRAEVEGTSIIAVFTGHPARLRASEPTKSLYFLVYEFSLDYVR